MTNAPTQSLTKSVAGVIRDHVGKAFRVLADRDEELKAELKAEIAELKAELAELKAERAKSPADWYLGVWKNGQHYVRGQQATDHGGLWMALAPTSARPGTSADWKLTAKGWGDAR